MRGRSTSRDWSRKARKQKFVLGIRTRGIKMARKDGGGGTSANGFADAVRLLDMCV